MAADKPERLHEKLSERGRELAPVLLRIGGAPTRRADAPARIVESRRYRSRAYVCRVFHKPISRCLDLDE